MKTLGIIPARFASSRLPGKPLADIGGKPMIQWVYENTSGELENLIVATDHPDIEKAVRSFGGRVMMTSPDHSSGTDRCAEVVRQLAGSGEAFDVVVNVQGDEPFIQSSHVRLLKEAFHDPDTQIATLANPILDGSEALDPNIVKVVADLHGRALYFSRAAIPYKRPGKDDLLPAGQPYLKHLGLYAYRGEVLRQITVLEPSPLEQAESLEQLRWLENGFIVKVRITAEQGHGIDTPGDLEAARRKFNDGPVQGHPASRPHE